MDKSLRPKITKKLLNHIHEYLLDDGYDFYMNVLKCREKRNWYIQYSVMIDNYQLPFSLHKFGSNKIIDVMYASGECNDWSQNQFEDWWYEVIDFMLASFHKDVGFGLIDHLPNPPDPNISNYLSPFMRELARL